MHPTGTRTTTGRATARAPGDASPVAPGRSRPDDAVGEGLAQAVAALAPEHPARAAAVAAAVAHWAPMAGRIAGSFRRRTREPEDLRQVAMPALVQALLRYEPGVGAFPAYAVPCITGEIRRWLRDFRGLVHVPRRVVELDVRAVAVEEHLLQQLGRSPSSSEVGLALGVDREAVRRARAGRAARHTDPVDAVAWHPATGFHDPGLELVDDRAAVEPLLERLDERSRTVLVMRYFGERTQSEIATEVGLSQVQVSRIIRRSLDRLRQLAG
ncbi:sigma-70 family RNA polymerase sigma factor [Jannaschia sp. R86511]|uniref:sigma-70 family RNA polymerase sigma factor n=1 Tax=Jannaschia sp. R86511 TaxID=3093853 RepID=UPI0036D30A31